MVGDTSAGQAAIAGIVFRHIRANVRRAIEFRAMSATLNDDPALRRPLDQTIEANGARIVQEALLHGQVSILTRLFDPPRRDRASLPRLMSQLDEKAVHDHFIDAAGRWTPVMRDSQRQACERYLESAQNAYQAFLRDDLASDALKSLRWFRNQHLSHSLIRGGRQGRLLYGHIGDVLDRTRPIVADLAFALRGEVMHGDGDEEARHVAQTFWETLGAGLDLRRRAEEAEHGESSHD